MVNRIGLERSALPIRDPEILSFIKISSTFIWVLNDRDESMASLYRASKPSISLVGSGSAYPSFFARSNAALNSILFSSISVRIKLLVPLIIALIVGLSVYLGYTWNLFK